MRSSVSKNKHPKTLGKTTMKINTCPIALTLITTAWLGLWSTHSVAQEMPASIVGKNDWIFYNHEFVRNIPETDRSVKLISQISKILEDNGTTVLIALAPIKSRIYEEYLPDTRKLTADHKDDYNRLLTQFKVLGVNTVDINSAFLNSPKRTSEFPLYFRHDTHWAAPGALLAAETIKAAIQNNSTLKQAYDQTPETKFNLLWATQRFPMTGDLLQQMPPGSPKYEQEMISAFEVLKQGGGGTLLGDEGSSGVALLGSSYTATWTQFPSAINYALQRDVVSLFFPANLGQWYGLDAYLRNDAFQKSRPKLLIWEMPERDLKAAPSLPYREARYIMENDEWIARVAASVQKSCQATGNSANLAKGNAAAASTTAADAIEIGLTKASSNQEYFSAQLMTNGSKMVTVELSGPGATSRKYQIETAGDESEHTFRIPLLAKTKGFTKMKLTPGATKGFAVKSLEVCSLPPGLVQ
jgi:alginate O-acetyltransferase complex protein AlgJ